MGDERLANRRAAHQRAVIAQQRYSLVAEIIDQRRAHIDVELEPAEIVIGDLADKPYAVLVDRQQPVLLRRDADDGRRMGVEQHVEVVARCEQTGMDDQPATAQIRVAVLLRITV